MTTRNRNRAAARSMAKAIEERRATPRAPRAGDIELTYEESERQYAALEALSQRALATTESEDKVFTLLRMYEPGHQQFVKLRNKEIEKFPAPKGSDESDLPAHIVEERSKAVQKLLETTHRMPRIPPTFILTKDDMPRRDIKGEVGMANKTSVAFIKHRLGFLFPVQEEQPEDPHRDAGGDEE